MPSFFAPSMIWARVSACATAAMLASVIITVKTQIASRGVDLCTIIYPPSVYMVTKSVELYSGREHHDIGRTHVTECRATGCFRDCAALSEQLPVVDHCCVDK